MLFWGQDLFLLLMAQCTLLIVIFSTIICVLLMCYISTAVLDKERKGLQSASSCNTCPKPDSSCCHASMPLCSDWLAFPTVTLYYIMYYLRRFMIGCSGLWNMSFDPQAWKPASRNINIMPHWEEKSSLISASKVNYAAKCDAPPTLWHLALKNLQTDTIFLHTKAIACIKVPFILLWYFILWILY